LGLVFNRSLFETIGPPTFWTLYLFGFNMGNVLTIAVVHTVQVGRYVQNQLIFTLLAESAGALLLIVFVERILTGACCRKVETTSKASEVPASVA
jgi:hypothetical protein